MFWRKKPKPIPPHAPAPEDLPYEPDPKAAQAWQTALVHHFENEYTERPLPDRRTFSPEQEHQCRIIGGALIGWAKFVPQNWMAERSILHRDFKVDPDPVIVFLSTIPGLVAAREILGRQPEHITYLPFDSYAAFTTQHPDPTFRWHVRFSSYITPHLEPDEAARAAAYPLAPGECYWVQHDATDLAILFGRYFSQLWKFNGHETDVLEPNFKESIS